ncbi:putative pentatricopeptide repeat-containing protein At5g36300 [Wolffia australiana]
MNRLYKSYACSGFAPRKTCEIYVKAFGLASISVDTQEGELDQVCNSLRGRINWDNLDVSLGKLELSSSLVDRVLIHLREPSNAKRSLSFFHWCSQRKKHNHGVRSFCLMIHILVQAGLTADATALLESILQKNSNSESSLFDVAETLISTHKDVQPGHRAFDLLVQTCSKLRFYFVAFRICCHHEQLGFMPSLISFNTLLHVVQRSGQKDLTWEIYEFMIFKRIYPNQFTIEIMTESMCKEGTLLRMVAVLDQIHPKRCSPTVIVNAALVLRIIEQGRTEEGILLARRMLQKNLILDIVASSLIIHAYCRSGNSNLAIDSQDEMLKRGHPMNAFVSTALIELHIREGKAEAVEIMLQKMHLAGLKPYEETYNVLIIWFSKQGRLEEAWNFCKRMVDGKCLPSNKASEALIGRLCESGHVEKAEILLTRLMEKGFSPGELIYCDLISGFGRTGKFQSVLRLYNEVEWREVSVSVLLYKAVIRSLFLCGKPAEAEKIFSRLKKKFGTSSMIINELMMPAD